MSIRMNPFISGISFDNKTYTPKQVFEYLANTSGDGFADKEKMGSLVEESNANFKKLVSQYDLDMSQELKADSSEAGKKLAELAKEHESELMSLIINGANSRGILI